MNTHGASQLRQARNGRFDFASDLDHQIGQLVDDDVRSIYNSGGSNLKDVARDVYLCVQGFEDYLPSPSVDKDGKYIPESKREVVIKQTYIKKK